jgi:hypothetical protein
MTTDEKPWVALGISKSHYYKTRQKQIAAGEASLPGVPHPRYKRNKVASPPSVVYTPTPTPTDAVYGPLQAAFNFFNRALFADRLPECLITLRALGRTKGYFSPGRYTSADGTKSVDEIAMNSTYFRVCTPKETASTLVHEMVHARQHHFGTPPRKSYHDREWAAMMREIGLMPSSTGAPGGKETGYTVSHYIIEGGRFDTAFAEFERTGQTIGWGDTAARGKAVAEPKRTKLVCPACRKINVSTPNGYVALIEARCLPCNRIMIVEDEGAHPMLQAAE